MEQVIAVILIFLITFLSAKGYKRTVIKEKWHKFIYYAGFVSVIYVGFLFSLLTVATLMNKSYILTFIIVLLPFWYAFGTDKLKSFTDKNKTQNADENIEDVEDISEEPIISFDYCDRHNNKTTRQIIVEAIDDQYIAGFDLDRKATRTFKIERIGTSIINCETGEIFDTKKWIDKHSFLTDDIPATYFADFNYSDSNIKEKSQLEIAFTGFIQAKRDELEAKAELNDYLVRKGVTKHLDILVCGNRASTKKIEKAQEQGAIIYTEEEFVNSL